MLVKSTQAILQICSTTLNVSYLKIKYTSNEARTIAKPNEPIAFAEMKTSMERGYLVLHSRFGSLEFVR